MSLSLSSIIVREKHGDIELPTNFSTITSSHLFEKELHLLLEFKGNCDRLFIFRITLPPSPTALARFQGLGRTAGQCRNLATASSLN